MTPAPTIALTVDLEDEHDGLGVERRGSMLRGDVEWLLEQFARFDVRATFFVLGSVLREHGELVRRVAAHGHEIASHGPDHAFLHQTTPREFAADLREHLAPLQQLAGARVSGFRAPFFSVTAETSWCLEVLRTHGFDYDASIYPARNDRYGWPGAPTEPARHGPTGLILFPVPIHSRLLPIGFSGGAYLRILPFRLIVSGLNRQAARNRPGMIYVHPWEVSTTLRWRGDARLRANITRHAFRGRMRPRLLELLTRYRPRLGPMRDVIAGLAEVPTWSGTGPAASKRRAGGRA
jgi:polysaccharide deacetylase family protein (PEP-CTERM system associated)